MDHALEQLGPERFQEVCQALLVTELPGIQCFPVGMPDGGRDAVRRIPHPDGGETRFIVFQVKFSRNPQGETDPHRWLHDVLAEEAPKVAKLISRGATAYYLLTNVRATSHLDSGSLDRVDALLRKHLTIPATCWWRDDINRRLDATYDIKWAYPELLSGPDILRALVHSALTEDRDRRTSAIAAFLREQYERDKEIRFKQVELRNDLFNLFIDTPLGFRRMAGDRRGDERRQEHVFRHLTLARRVHGPSDAEDIPFDQPEPPGAAEMLLDRRFQAAFPVIVLEGAPGQGKSTVTQLVAQVYRARLLGDTDPLQSSPGARLPIRIDLRDYAVWLDKRDPFSVEDDQPAPPSWNKSLESYIAALIHHMAGGAQFTVADLHAVARLSPLTIVLDGLDEVADIEKRTTVIAELTTGLKRLKEVSLSLQGIITSRPAAFSKTLGFEGAFPHFSLLALPESTIREYATKWVSAKRLPAREAADAQRILKTKLTLPHFRELATNPMQLAILLSLINARGASLPDKRTALYDSYVELFFSREAEKSEVVRRHRDLLLDVHRYLAWVLHGEAELGKHRGNVSADRLTALLHTYLAAEGHDQSLAAALRSGMVERIVFLVSRVEGTFEFEVQPIREYFAARHLYETAPYSPPGREASGTKPDRFLAIAANPYWLNVSRFFAGCFSKGELPALLECLLELGERSEFRFTGEPRRLAAMLLADWVFAQSARTTSSAIKLLADGLQASRVVTRRRSAYHYPEAELALPDECGRREFLSKCVEVLRSVPASDYSYEICTLIKANGSVPDILAVWSDGLSAFRGRDRERWFMSGLYLGALPHASESALRAAEPLTATELGFLLHGGNASFVAADDLRAQQYVDAVLDGTLAPWSPNRTGHALTALTAALNWEGYDLAFQHPGPSPLSDVIAHWGFGGERDESPEAPNAAAVFRAAARFAAVAQREQARDASEWVHSLAPWQSLVCQGRELFGDRWAFYRIANLCGGIRVNIPEGHLSDICAFAAGARLRGRAPSWWVTQLSNASKPLDRRFLALLMLTWGTPSAFEKAEPLVAEVLEDMPDDIWQVFSRDAEDVIRSRSRRARPHQGVFPKSKSPRLASLMLWKTSFHPLISGSPLERYRGRDPYVIECCARAALNEAFRDAKRWSTALRLISRSYAATLGAIWPRILETSPEDLGRRLEAAVAHKVVAHARVYPRVLVHAAEQACRIAAAKSIEPVLRIAETQGWFPREQAGLTG